MGDTVELDSGPLHGFAAGMAATVTALKDPTFVKRAAAEVARIAGPRTPRQTGRLAGSVSIVPEEDGAGVRWGVGYAVFVNFGTRTMRARPFATDALRAAETKVEDLARTWAEDALQEAHP